MNRAYIFLLMHFLICILVFTLYPYIVVLSNLPYGIIGISLSLTVLLIGWLFIKYPSERMNPFTLLSVIYSLQFSVSLYLTKFHVIVSRNALMRYYNNIDEVNLVNALQLAYVFSFVVLCIAFLFANSSVWAKILRVMSQALVKEGKLLFMVVLGITIIEFILIATGKVTLQGESLVGKDVKNIEVNPLVAIVNPIACLAVFLSAYLYSNSRNKQLILLMIIQFVWFFLWGRRQIVFYAFLAFLGFYFNQRIIISRLTLKGFQKIVIASVLFFVVVTAARFYQQLRTIGGVAVLQNVTISSLQKVFQLYKSSDNQDLRHASEYNIELRALSTVAAVAHYDKLIEAGGLQRGKGLEVYNNFLKATPSNYFVDKASVLVMEGLASELTGGKVRSHRDLGGTLILESMIDFGRIGVIIYPFILAVIISLFYLFLLKIGNPFIVLWFVIALVYSILSMVEGSIGDLFIAMRATLFVVFILSIIWFFQKIFKSKKIIVTTS